MQTPTPPPADPTAALVVASLDHLSEREAAGRRVLMRDGYASLAVRASDLRDALFSLQSDGIRGSEDVNSGPLEDLCGLLQRLADDAREGREAA